MGIYLPNMEMPENCICCDLSHEDGWCPAKQTYTDSYTFKTCPLIPVPPHGRCIDANSKTFPTPHRNPSNEYMKGWNACLRSVQQQPTVIPADVPDNNVGNIPTEEGE